MKQCLIDGHHIAYTRSGNPNGDTLVLVHGITTYSFIWYKLIPHLAQKFDIIALDLLGCGKSDMPLDVSYAIKDHAQRLHSLAKQLDIDSFHLIGHDLGGGISQIFAVEHPDMLQSLTLINTVAYDFWPVQPITALRTPIIRQLLMGAMDLGMFRVLVKAGLYHKELVNDELMQLFWLPLQQQLGRKAFMHFARCLEAKNLTDITPNLMTLAIPTLILWGDADPFLNPTIAQRLHHDIPHSKLHQIATASHYLILDEPAWAAQHIQQFIVESHA